MPIVSYSTELLRQAADGQKTEQGFTLVEVLVALVIIAVGLLGIAGMNALAISNTSVARTRSLAAIFAQSLSAAMGANPAYWAGTTGTGVATSYKPPALMTVTSSGGSVTLGDSVLNGLNTDCVATSCPPDAMAAYDVKKWGADVAAQLPGGTGNIACAVTTKPYVCVISVAWSEKYQALKPAAGNIAAPASAQTFQLIVQP